jgi:hypothetical protein
MEKLIDENMTLKADLEKAQNLIKELQSQLQQKKKLTTTPIFPLSLLATPPPKTPLMPPPLTTPLQVMLP